MLGTEAIASDDQWMRMPMSAEIVKHMNNLADAEKRKFARVPHFWLSEETFLLETVNSQELLPEKPRNKVISDSDTADCDPMEPSLGNGNHIPNYRSAHEPPEDVVASPAYPRSSRCTAN